MKILQEIKERAQSNPQRIVLPEGDEPRTLEAANTVIKDKVAEIKAMMSAGTYRVSGMDFANKLVDGYSSEISL